MDVSGAAFAAGLVLSLSTIVALGPQNVHILRMGLTRQHVALTVGLCLLGDAVLIGLSVLGLAQWLSGRASVHGAMIGAGAAFLLAYGWQAAQRFVSACGAAQPSLASVAVLSRRQAAAAALGFSLLNPHAWLDTAVIIGGASLAWGSAQAPWFGAGALAGSALWFVLFSALAVRLGQGLMAARLWRGLDAAVALLMWGMAAWLVAGLW